MDFARRRDTSEPEGRAYVSCDASHQVAEIGLTGWKVKLIDAGRGADGLAWAPGKQSGAAGP